jgi:small subunit ribosomal protein S16
VAVKIRLMRVGKKKQPTYRVVVADARSPRDGRFIEILGQYEPRHDPSRISVDTDRIVHWLQHGAQPTEQVAKILEVAGIWDAFKTATGKEAAAKPKPRPAKAKTEKPAKNAAAEPPAPTASTDTASDDASAEADTAEADTAEATESA